MQNFVSARPIGISRLLTIGVLLSLSAWPAVSSAATSDITISASGANGSGIIDQPGIACADGGDGASWHYDYSAALAGGTFTSIPGDLGLHLDLHSEAAGDPPTYDGAWLQPGQSQVTISNGRGSVKLDLVSGSCGVDTLAFDGAFASGAGTWSVAEGTGSYRQSTGSGTFSLSAGLGPGSENPFEIDLVGSLAVLDPSLQVEVVRAAWDPPHGPSEFRHATVTYLVTNVGPGDAFSVLLETNETSPSSVLAEGPLPQALGDLAAGDGVLVELQYRLDRGPCELVDRGCAFDSTLSVDMSDALDQSATSDSTVRVRIPTQGQN